MALRLPKRAAMSDETESPMSEATPLATMAAPTSVLLISSASLIAGTREAHVEKPRPHTAKIAKIAERHLTNWVRVREVWDMGSSIVESIR